ncbi:hypothetical protein [Oscillibacter ruminantium]|uniref:hypothetical protein n=1 Tax=Oscillibacter ruminantium TaxID=1263547 RepID=UPI00031AE12B|nr:hypothetical protein [Oscillibacter ruminantium]MDN0031401.1 hypothetical protein [Oscillibacter valericigenes]MEA5041768.1 hypothetical protein [Oscillibacter ruminantium]
MEITGKTWVLLVVLLPLTVFNTVRMVRAGQSVRAVLYVLALAAGLTAAALVAYYASRIS